MNNKQVRILLNNESETDLINNILACKSEVINYIQTQTIYFLTS